MNEDFFDFLKVPSEENFQKSQQYVMNHKDYNPYSSDLDEIIAFLDAKEFDKAVAYKSINTILSPSAHLMKQFAYSQLQNEEGANAEQFLFTSIIENLVLTGNGSQSEPYVVTQISDERDILEFLDEKFKMQRLISNDGKHFDLIDTNSGRSIYFDITVCYRTMSHFSSEDIEKQLDEVFVKEEIVKPSESIVKEDFGKITSEDTFTKTASTQNIITEKQPEKKKWWKRK